MENKGESGTLEAVQRKTVWNMKETTYILFSLTLP